MPFDAQAARRAGYSDAEIAQYLAQKDGFDINAAKRSGYNDREIADHLIEKRSRADRGNGLLARATDGALEILDDPRVKMAGRAASGIGSMVAGYFSDKIEQNARDGTFASDAAKDEGFTDRAGSLLERGTAGIGAGMYKALGAATGSRRAFEEGRALDKTQNAKIAGQTTWQDVKDRPGIDTVASYALDAGIESAPGMAVAAIPMLGVPTYAASNAGNIADQRAQNDSQTEATFGDLLASAPAAVASAYLERVGPRIAATIPGKNVASGIVRAALAEAGTEALQSSVEYAGASIGTEKGFSAAEMGDQALAGAVAGAGMGGAIRGTVEASKPVMRLGERFSQRPIAPGIRASAAGEAAILTPEDHASPIPNDLIAAGKAEVADATAKGDADSILAAAGMPGTGKRVAVTMPDGSTSTGTVRDAFHTDAGALGTASGIAIDMDNGTVFTDHFDTLAEAGVKIVETRDFDPTAEADAIDASLAVPAEPDLTSLNTNTRPAEEREGGKFLPPVGNARVSSAFGARHAPKAGASTNHGGMDFAVPVGTPVASSAAGRVTFAGVDRRGGGNVVKIDHGNGVETVYAHLDGFKVNVGDSIEAGQVIATSGNSGNSTGPHLHFSVKRDGVRVDPAGYLNKPFAGEAASKNTPEIAASEPQDAQTAPDQPEGRSYLNEAMARSFGQVVGDPIDNEWSKFSDTSGTLNVPRDEMPQIKAEHRGAMVNFLNARGITHEEQDVPAGDLKPTQAEFSNAKVQQAREYNGGNRAILTSSDGYVLDGHHQWMAALSKGEDVRTIRLNAPIADLLKTVPEFPSATDAQGSTDTKPVEIPATYNAQETAAQQQEMPVEAATPDAAQDTSTGAEAPAATIDPQDVLSVVDGNNQVRNAAAPFSEREAFRTGAAFELGLLAAENPRVKEFAESHNEQFRAGMTKAKAELTKRRIRERSKADAGEQDLRARPDLGPLFADPEGSINRMALLRAANEGRGNSTNEGGRRWLIREGYAETDKRGKITGLTDKGKAELVKARDATKATPSESDPDQVNDAQAPYNPREGESYKVRNPAGLTDDQVYEVLRDNDASKRLEWKGDKLDWFQVPLTNGDGAIIVHKDRNEARRFTGKGWAQYAHAYAIDHSGDGKTPAPTTSTAPEHAQVGVDDRELSQIVDEFNAAQASMVEGDDKVTHVFDPPAKSEVVRLADKVKVFREGRGWMTPAEAKAEIAKWKAHAQAQGGPGSANADKVVLSLFDLTGEWSKPWEEAGYQVYRFDIQDDPEVGDVHNFSTEFFGDWFGDFDGQDIYAILAACPCTDFAVSGARHFAAKDADGRTVASVKLVHKTLATIEYFKPAVWAIENPVGRIEKLGGLPPWRLSFDPSHIGETYTKKTLLWGRFNGDLPIAPVEPVEGSKMHAKYGGKSLATKNARSATPEGFAYSFFMANNAVDHPAMALANKFDRLDRDLIKRALDAGVTEEQITTAVEDFYYQELDDDAANAAIRDLLPSPPSNSPTIDKVRADWENKGLVKPKSGQGAITQMPGKRTNKEYLTQGWNAAQQGFTIDDDPYYASSTASDQWRKGWRDGVKSSAAPKPGYIEPDRGAAAKPDLKPTDEATIALLTRMAEAEDEGRVQSIESASLRVRMMIDEGLIAENKGKNSGAMWITTEKGRAALDAAGIRHGQSPANVVDSTTTAKPTYGQSNKVFTADAAEKARALLRAKRDQLNAGFDPEVAQAGLTLMGYHIEAGARAFIDASRAVAADLGMTPAELRNNLRSWYSSARIWFEDNDLDTRGMDDDATVKVDMARIDQWGTKAPESAIAPQAEESNDADAKQAGTQANDRNGDEERRAGDVPPIEGGRETAGRADRPNGAGDAGLRADAQGLAAEDRAEADAGRADAGKRTGEARRSGNRAQPGDRVPGSPKPERPDRGLNFLAPSGTLKREGGWKATAERNLDIVELVNRLDAENRVATPEEQALLVKFTGWGAGDIRNNLFRNVTRNAAGERRIVPPSYGEWKEMGERAAKLLTGDALETALQSTQYAHYTSEQVIRSIWSGLRRLGFNGGKIVEPGMGTGLFAVAAPTDVFGRSNYTGIELDGFTAKVAQYLLPQETVLPGDYTKTKLPDGFFDIAIGNPPFANVKVTDDPAYKKHRFSLHDYFFAKTIDKVRPGGLLVFVTSRYTMDKLDPKARQYIADRADLIAAIRLPQTAFKENAGTEVVTDVLFLQRRAPGAEAAGQAWLTSEPLAIGPDQVNVNSYYLAHPEMVLGKHATTGSMYRKNEYTVEPGEGSIEAAFAKAIENLPENVYIEAAPKAASDAVARTVEADMRPAAEKEGGVYLKDGEVFRRDDGVGRPVSSLPEKLSAKDVAWLKDYVPLRDAVKQAQRDQLKDGDWEASLKALNKVYDSFVKKHGQISTFTVSERTFTDEDGNENTVSYKRFANRKRLEVDIESSLVEALEKVDDEGKISKSPFLMGRTLKKPTRPEINSAADAVAVTLDEIGRFDLSYVGKLLGKSEDAVIAELGDEIYQHPDGTWIMADEYLSGDVVAKLDEAKVAAQSDTRFERNVEALVKVQPRPLAYSDINVKLGAGWVEAHVVEQFAQEVLNENLEGIRYESATGSWTVPDSSRRWGRTSTSEWATDDRSARELLDAVLNNRTIKVLRTDNTDGKKTTWTDQEATALANERAKKMADRFKTWIWTDGPRTTRLVDKYNRLFNNLAPRKFDGKHLTFPGLSTRYSLYDHQRRAIWRVIATGNTYLNHAVGAGKTLEMIVAGMEQRRLGLIRKPMYVVPNHMLNQFAREFLDAYPAANIMVADEQAFHTGNRRRFMAQAALNDPDAVIVSHTSFGKIQTSSETRAKVVDRFISELEEIMEELKGQDNRIARSKVEKQIEQIRRRFEGKAASEGKDKALTFEDMGVDFLFLDEAHEFRKLDFATNRTAVKGIDANGSQRSLDLYTKLLWLNEQRPGRAAVLASGTPVTNTMAEIFTVMRYMDQAGLERDGLAAFDAWAAMFGEVVAGFEQNAAGSYEMVERFSKFVNVPEMMKRVRSFMDVLTSDQLGDIVKRPSVKGGLPENVIAEASDDLEQYMKTELLTRIEVSRKWKPSKDQPGNPDPIINIITDGRLSAIDMRFVDKMAGNDPNSKLNLMIDKIIAKHKEFADVEYTDAVTGKALPRKGATQIVFSAVGFGDMVAKSRGFDARAWIDKRLAEAGVPKDAVAWMSDQNSHAKKESTFKAMRNAEKRILLGSPKNMGTGVNVQGRLKVLHYLSPPWYPSDVEQPHGRIIRQGNMNGEAEIYWYATKGTYDSTAWNMVSRKQRFIEQAMRGDDSIRSLEDISEANQYEMASALAAGDERVIQLAGLSNEIERLTKLKAAHAEEQVNLKWRMEALQRLIDQKTGASARLAGAIEARGTANQPFSISVDGVRYEKQGEAGQAMIDAAQRAVDGYALGDPEVETEIGRYQGILPVLAVAGTGNIDGKPARLFDVIVRAGPVDLTILEQRRSLESTDPTGFAQRVGNALSRLESEKRRADDDVEQAKTELAQARRKAGAPFEYEADLGEKVAERERMQSEMAAETEAAQKAADAPKVQEEGAKFEAAVAEPQDEAYNASDEQAPDLSRRNADDPLWGLGGAGSVSIRGLGIATEIERTGSAALVGQTAASPKELGALAQVYRDPRYETFRVFFTKGDEIVHATGVTSRLPGETPLLPGGNDKDGEFEAWLEQHMASSGADGYYLLHNHPSGEPKPSKEDIAITRRIAGNVPGYRGHVVINSNRFAVIGSVGNVDMHDLWTGEDKLLAQSKPHPILGQSVGRSSLLAQAAKAVQQPDYLTIIATDPRFGVRAIIDFPRAHLEKSDLRLLAAARKLTRATGTTHIMLVGTREDLQHPTVTKAFRKGFIFEATDGDTSLMAQIRRDPGVDPEKQSSFAKVSPAAFVSEERAPYAAEPVRFDDPETEARFQAAKEGLAAPQTLIERAQEWAEHAWHGISRHWIALPNVPKYAALQQKLRAIESAPQHARERTVAMLEDMVKDFTKDDLDLFTRKVILDDLSWDAANERDLPFGFTPQTLLAEKAKVDAQVQADPDKKVWKAAMKRKVANRRIAQELVEAGVLEAEQIKNPAYYRHQVLEYARAQAQYARTPGKKLRTPKWAKRMGSTMDINANLLEAEFDWLNKAFIDIPVAQTIEWIKKSDHNILEGLRDEAKAGNKSGVEAKLAEAKEVLEDPQASDDEKMEAAALIDQEKGFRQYIAMGFDHVRQALRDGEIDVPVRHMKAADAIEGGKGAAGDPPFAFLSWILDSDQPGAMGAAMILKAISQRRVWTKNLLGRDYIDPGNADELVKRLAPEGYRTWQPDEGKLLFTVKTMPEHVIDSMIQKLDAPDGIDPAAFRAALEGARSQLAMGGDRYTMILPEEVADTLSNLRRTEMDGLFEHLLARPLRLWKRWVLINPRRFFKYNLNNLSGDLDAVIAGNPRLLKQVGRAGRELADVKLGKAPASERYNEAVARGVFDSGLSIQEIPDINTLAPFERFAAEPGKINKLTLIPLRKAWNALQGVTQWRENVFRYAAYLDYVERVEGGESQASIGYGASLPKMVDAVTDPKDKAALLARDLLGDYGAISHYGGWLRQTVIPFWSWTEINTKRYWRLTGNAYAEGVGKGLATGTGLAVAQGARTSAWLAIRMAAIYGLVSLWNGLFFAEEEEELDEFQQAQMHLVLGRNKDGDIITMRLQGAFSDALSWFGLRDMAKAARNYELGRGDLWAAALAAPKAAINKIGTSLSPAISLPVEAMTGKKIWPDVFNTRVNRDGWRNLFSSFSLEHEYDAALGKPSRGYGRSWQEAFVYRKDPGEIAYNEARGIAYDWLKREKGQSFEGGITSDRSEAARNYRTAIKYGDQTAADRALARMAGLGVDQGDFDAMIKRAAPLGPIAKKDRQVFLDQLTEDEYRTFVRAQGWYQETFLGAR